MVQIGGSEGFITEDPELVQGRFPGDHANEPSVAVPPGTNCIQDQMPLHLGVGAGTRQTLALAIVLVEET